jgi:hypothetical protein
MREGKSHVDVGILDAHNIEEEVSLQSFIYGPTFSTDDTKPIRI